MEKIKLEKVLDWTEGKLEDSDSLNRKSEIDISDISKDTRTIKDGDIYIAIPGKTFDGHDFINQAFSSGASYAIAERLDTVSDEYKSKVILVNNTMDALNNIASGYIKYLNIPVVGITGSVGKTTTKEMIASVLSAKYKVLKTQENLNNTIGAPFTALELDSSYDIAVIEGGMNHQGELESISKAITPSVCVITNIGDSHIGNLGSRENIFKAKCELFKYMKEDAKLVLNKDDDFLPSLKENTDYNNHEIIYRGLSDIKNEVVVKEEGKVNYETDDFKFTCNSLVRNIAQAALLAREVGKIFNMTDDEIRQGILKFNNIGKRMEEVKLNKVTVLSDYYNACFASIESGIQTLLNYKKDNNRVIAILGDVLELGEYEKDIHTKIGDMLNKYNPDKIYFVGNNIKYAFEAYNGNKEYFETKENFMDILEEIFYKDDVVLLKASNGCKFSEIFDKMKEMNI